ncbi:hypothetical protein COO60DRAFT_1459348 [Scenedesmus sp. NREL 46B-D3]|nr:hypothetical protein COO60DRAFT_1459348 [Scenedesmus sp. NREL 46B-D3]
MKSGRRAFATCLLALACVSVTTEPAAGRRLSAWDAWPTAPKCPGLPTANSAKDGSGRLWGVVNGRSCAFKDEQQQALYPNVATPKQEWNTAPTCGEAPSEFNSAPDSLNLLWGVWWSKSCAFKTAANEPVYYSVPALPSPALPIPPAPLAGSSPACLAQPLWEKFSYGTNGYEGNTLTASEGPSSNTASTRLLPVRPDGLRQKQTGGTELATSEKLLFAQADGDCCKHLVLATVTVSLQQSRASPAFPGPSHTTSPSCRKQPCLPGTARPQTRRLMLALLTQRHEAAELMHPVQQQAAQVLKPSSRHVLQESTSHQSELMGNVGQLASAAVARSLPEDDNITASVPTQPPPELQDSTTTTNASTTDRLR